jgi:hypothetical protein
MKTLAEYMLEATNEEKNLGGLKKFLQNNNRNWEEIKSGWGSDGYAIAVDSASTKGVRAIFDFCSKKRGDNMSEFIYKIEKDGSIIYDEESTRDLDDFRSKRSLEDYCEPRMFFRSIVDWRKKQFEKAKRDYDKKSRSGAASDYELQKAEAKYNKCKNIYATL